MNSMANDRPELIWPPDDVAEEEAQSQGRDPDRRQVQVPKQPGL